MTKVATQTSPPKGIQPQNYVTATEQPQEIKRNEPVRFLSCSKNCPTDILESEEHTTTTFTGDTTIPPLTMTPPLYEEVLERDEQTNEFYLPLTSTVVLQRKQEMLYVPLDFGKDLTVDVLGDSEVYVSAIAQNDLDTMKQKAPNIFLKIDYPPKFLLQVANRQLGKPLATTTLEFEIADNIFAENFSVIMKLTGPMIGLQFLRNNSVAIDTTHGLINFPHLTMQVETASNKTAAKPQPVITDNTTKDNKKSQLLLIKLQNGAQQGL